MGLKQSALKAMLSHKCLRDGARLLLNEGVKYDWIREILIDHVLRSMVNPSSNFIKKKINEVKEKEIRKIFTEEEYRETALDYLEMLLENDHARNLLIKALCQG